MILGNIGKAGFSCFHGQKEEFGERKWGGHLVYFLLLVEACLFCFPGVPVGHCFLTPSCPDLFLLKMSKIVDHTIFVWV